MGSKLRSYITNSLTGVNAVLARLQKVAKLAKVNTEETALPRAGRAAPKGGFLQASGGSRLALDRRLMIAVRKTQEDGYVGLDRRRVVRQPLCPLRANVKSSEECCNNSLSVPLLHSGSATRSRPRPAVDDNDDGEKTFTLQLAARREHLEAFECLADKPEGISRQLRGQTFCEDFMFEYGGAQVTVTKLSFNYSSATETVHPTPSSLRIGAQGGGAELRSDLRGPLAQSGRVKVPGGELYNALTFRCLADCTKCELPGNGQRPTRLMERAADGERWKDVKAQQEPQAHSGASVADQAASVATAASPSPPPQPPAPMPPRPVAPTPPPGQQYPPLRMTPGPSAQGPPCRQT